MKIQVTLYDCERELQLTRHTIDVPKKEWEALNFLNQEQYCKRVVEKTLHWHWRELEENET